PLGGNRKGRIRTCINILVVYLVSGIWHGANWTYILWGCLHGIAQVLYRIFGKIWDRLPRFFRWIGTFLFVDIAFMLFRSDSLKDFGILCRNIVSGKQGGIASEIIQCFDVIEFTYLEDHIGVLGGIADRFPYLHVWIVMGIAFLIIVSGKNFYEKEFRPGMIKALSCIVLLVWSVISLSGLSTFLYFNF
ncbi:MAG: MBOAT family protein, partial [Lachnospiraceae bacterium]|nr:MBOAT family protein [Lachnospiraceae bacterium]